jgi:hypothetical protein
MAIIRQDRINNENISSINDLEEYISTEYLQVIQDRIESLKVKKQQINDKISLYNSLNNSNNIAKNALLGDSKYTTITNNQTTAEPLIDELNIVLKQLVSILSYKDILTLNNLNYNEDFYGTNKIDIIEGEFEQLQCPNPTIAKGIVNKDYLNKELNKIEQPPKPLQRLKYLTTDAGGNLQWTI